MSAVNWSLIRKTVQNWAATIVGGGVPVIWAKQRAPRPAKPFIELEVISSGDRDGGFDENRLDADGKQMVVHRRRMTITATAYSADVTGAGAAEALCDALSDSLEMETTSTTFRLAADLGIVGIEPTRDLSSLLTTRYEGRAAFDFRLAYHSEDEEDLGKIESVEVDQNFS